ncbi:unnamed protein product [Parnassius mnemosyne]|uniref:Reverse transcriptase n=1 Tax=Parnassius mnemosyne TaxID=213953 RepID=A0AAV1LI84_9NEOP
MASPSATDSPEKESTEVPEVTETRAAVLRLRAKNTAPGPYGVPSRALALALKELEPQLSGLFTARLEQDPLVSHLCREGPDLDEHQLGFRCGRSNIDVITRVRALAEETISRGGVVLAVSLDISNAFNTLPWSCIREALNYHRVPPYLRSTIGTYLEER